jgi:hypothetical protein
MRIILVISTFFLVTADIIGQLLEKIAQLTPALHLPLLLSTFPLAVLVGALVAHVLLSLMQGTNLLADLIQDEPVEHFVN